MLNTEYIFFKRKKCINATNNMKNRMILINNTF